MPVPSALDDISAAVALQPADMGLGTLVTKTLTPPDIFKGQVLLPNPAVQASIPQAAEHPLSIFTVSMQDHRRAGLTDAKVLHDISKRHVLPLLMHASIIQPEHASMAAHISM